MRCLTIVFVLLATARPALATFSIAAVDTITGEVGSAGASCVAGAVAFSDVHPGIGVIHMQAHWNYGNREAAAERLASGWRPAAIVAWLAAHDAQGSPGIRQYGIVALADSGRSAAYTGADCPLWAGHRTGPTYAVQGNILLGPQILAGMERAFLSTPGELAVKLMAALQGANVPGADTLCLAAGKPARSAFIRVARPGDSRRHYALELMVNDTPPGANPIDLLQEKFAAWLAARAALADSLPGAAPRRPAP